MNNTIPPKLAPLTPAEAMKKLRNIEAILRNHKAKAASRYAELTELLGTTDVSQILANEPEKFVKLSADAAALKAQADFEEMAIASFDRLVRELSEPALIELFRLQEVLAALLNESRALARSVTSSRLQHVCGGDIDQADIDYLVRRAPVMRAQAVFESVNPANITVPTASTVTNDVVTCGVHEDALREPSCFVICYDQLNARIEATKARIATLRQAETDFENTQRNEVGTLRKENAALRKLLAEK